jgi:lysosomal alpha-mannosidase
VNSPWLSQTTRLYAGQNNIEIEYQVGPIPWADGFGKEIITRFTSDIKSAQLFYTDSNGREVLERKINCNHHLIHSIN